MKFIGRIVALHKKCLRGLAVAEVDRACRPRIYPGRVRRGFRNLPRFNSGQANACDASATATPEPGEVGSDDSCGVAMWFHAALLTQSMNANTDGYRSAG
jgi:hypothetical protein